ncbi:MAG: OmpA family protein [Cyclobacteriaceae bacterium]
MRKITLLLAAVIGSTTAFAQTLPPVPQKDKCYALCTTQDEYKTEEVKVMTKPAYTKLEIIPAEYKTVTEEVIIKPESKKYTYVPATYKTVTETIITKSDYNKLRVLPSKFNNDFEVVKIKEEISRYTVNGTAPDCEDGKDCQLVCTQTLPAEYKSVPILTKANDETTNSSLIKGRSTKVTRQVEVTPAKNVETIIPAIKKTFTKTVLVKDETTKSITIPAEYTTVTKQVLVKQGGVQEWREVACASVSGGTVLPINYLTGSAALTPSSKKIIDDNLLKLLQDQPDTKIEIGSHTDARGSRSANQALSERRAKSVVDYLVAKGIAKNRLTYKGYGETRLLNKCADGVQCSGADHAVNRRTEFTVL